MKTSTGVTLTIVFGGSALMFAVFTAMVALTTGAVEPFWYWLEVGLWSCTACSILADHYLGDWAKLEPPDDLLPEEEQCPVCGGRCGSIVNYFIEVVYVPCTACSGAGTYIAWLRNQR